MRGIVALLLLSAITSLAVAQDAEKPVELTDDAKAALEQFDEDGDGKLSEAELPERGRKLYMRYDADKDGFLSGAELNEAARSAAELKGAAEKRGKGKIADAMRDDYKADEASGWFLQAAHDYHKATSGEALYIMKDGKLLFEACDNGYSKEREHQLASGTKSYCGIIAACAVEDGLIKWDELVSETITEWKEDKQRSRITVRMLLSLSAGLPPEQDALQGPATENKYAYAIGLKCKHEPGTRFEYGPAQYFAWGEFMRRKLAASEKFKDMNLTGYFMHRIGNEIGSKQTWRTDGAGNPATPHGVYVLASEWAKFGEFVRLGGKVGEKQLLKTELMDECFKPSKCNPDYGLTWWLGGGEEADEGGEVKRRKAEKAPGWMPADLVFAAGKGKQRLYVSRKLGLTIVRFANDKGSFDNNDFLSWLLRGKAA